MRSSRAYFSNVPRVCMWRQRRRKTLLLLLLRGEGGERVVWRGLLVLDERWPREKGREEVECTYLNKKGMGRK